MKSVPQNSHAGFTLVELLIGMSLSLVVMMAVLSTYSYLGRSLTRLVNQQTLETQARNTVVLFQQDAQNATRVSIVSRTAPEFQVTFTLNSSSGTKEVTYFYGTSTSISGHTVTAPSGTLTRVVNEPNAVPAFSSRAILSNLLSSNDGCYIRFFDAAGNAYDNGTAPYTPVTTYAPNFKQVLLSFSLQTGLAGSGTQTPVIQRTTGRLVLRNGTFLQ